MKIGIVTFHWASNYGAVLQAYALLSYLRSRGLDAELVDYRPNWSNDVKKPVLPRSVRGVIHYCDELYRRRRFERFRKSYFVSSSQQYTSFSDISQLSEYDALVVGSDQVFNPDIIASSGKLDSVYLLDIPAFKGWKVAYAASFGNSSLNSQYKSVFQKLLSTFKAVGVRETSGLGILAELDLKNRTCVPDPTFLLDNYGQLDLPPKSQIDYILGIMFQPTYDSQHCIDQVKRQWPSAEFLKVLSFKSKLKGEKGFVHPSPEEWIANIRDARFVVTDSFHCTVFSILMHRPFISLSLDAWGADWCERIKSLLERLGLSHRFVPTYNPELIEKLLNTDIDWTEVDARILEWRKEGRSFLDGLFQK